MSCFPLYRNSIYWATASRQPDIKNDLFTQWSLFRNYWIQQAVINWRPSHTVITIQELLDPAGCYTVYTVIMTRQKLYLMSTIEMWSLIPWFLCVQGQLGSRQFQCYHQFLVGPFCCLHLVCQVCLEVPGFRGEEVRETKVFNMIVSKGEEEGMRYALLENFWQFEKLWMKQSLRPQTES